MQDNHLYEYAVIRVVPRVEREEFLNIGIILFCKKAKFIKVLSHIDDAKIETFSNDFDLEQLHCNITAFKKIATGDKDGGPIAEMDIPSRFSMVNGDTQFSDPDIQTASRTLSGFGKHYSAFIYRTGFIVFYA